MMGKTWHEMRQEKNVPVSEASQVHLNLERLISRKRETGRRTRYITSIQMNFFDTRVVDTGFIQAVRHIPSVTARDSVFRNVEGAPSIPGFSIVLFCQFHLDHELDRSQFRVNSFLSEGVNLVAQSFV